MKNRLIEFNRWKDLLHNWAHNIKAEFTISHDVSMGMMGDAYTIKIKYQLKNLRPIIISQHASGSKYEVVPSYIIFSYINESLINFNLSLYQKGFFERLFNFGRIKTGNTGFDKKFGIYTTDKHKAIKIFSDKRIQKMFLENKFLLINMQKEKSLLAFKSMETKLYSQSELQKLLDDFIYILNIIQNDKI